MSESDVLPRKLPTQARGKKTVEKILDATRDLLQADGHKAITTVSVAARAEINVASLYQYFPTKHAIFYVLYQDWLNSWVESVKGLIEENKSPDLDLSDFAETGFLAVLNSETNITLTSELMLAMQAHPELKAIEERHQDNIAALLSEASQQHLPGLSDTQRYESAVAMYKLTLCLIDIIWETSEDNRDHMTHWACKLVRNTQIFPGKTSS